LINFGGLGQLINDLAERYDLAGTYAAISFVILVSVCFFVLTEWIERWLTPVTSASGAPARPLSQSVIAVAALRSAIIVLVLASWEALALSGLLYRDVVPSLTAIGQALWRLLTFPDFNWHIDLAVAGSHLAADLKIPAFYQNLAVTAGEVGAG